MSTGLVTAPPAFGATTEDVAGVLPMVPAPVKLPPMLSAAAFPTVTFAVVADSAGAEQIGVATPVTTICDETESFAAFLTVNTNVFAPTTIAFVVTGKVVPMLVRFCVIVTPPLAAAPLIVPLSVVALPTVPLANAAENAVIVGAATTVTAAPAVDAVAVHEEFVSERPFVWVTVSVNP